MLPADSGRDHVADTLAAARRRNEQDVLRTVVQHEFFAKRVDSDDESVFADRKPRLFDVLFLCEICRAVAGHALTAFVKLVDHKSADKIDNPRQKRILREGARNRCGDLRIISPRPMCERLINMPGDLAGQEWTVFEMIGDCLCCEPLRRNIGDPREQEAEEKGFVLFFLFLLVHIILRMRWAVSHRHGMCSRVRW